MTKKILMTSCCIAALLSTTIAQETEQPKKVKPEKKVTKKVVIVDDKNKNEEILIDEIGDDKKDKKVKVIVNGNKKSNKDKDVKVFVDGEEIENAGDVKHKKITVLVDGDKVTINGKPVEEMNDDEIEVLRGKADHLKLIAPYLRGSRGGQAFNFRTPMPPMEMGEDLDILMDKGITDLPQTNKALLGVVTDKDEKGAKINNISKESAAEKAGLQKDDIITKVNDDKIENSEDLIKAIGKYSPDEKVKVTYLRDGKTKSTEATLQKNNAKASRVFSFNGDDVPFEMAPFANDQNFDFKQFNRTTKPKIGFKIQDIEEGNGVKILDVDAETPAAKAGLQKGDIIVDINGEVLKNVDELKEKLATAKEGDVLKIKYKRDGVTQSTEVKFPKKLKTADL
ncbi:MAG: PDZ domain-containing protein [Bacteroidetes bacterium]|nr:PDZ domain-containing protein [Bacteroidota bacterium]